VTPDGEFVELRPVLFGIAYRMLGSASEAEDVVQEAYLRWAGVDYEKVASPRSYISTIVTRLSIDHLRDAKLVGSRIGGSGSRSRSNRDPPNLATRIWPTASRWPFSCFSRS
jgi:DNA-directed RNA polymerase specialized sigma24 family protein